MYLGEGGREGQACFYGVGRNFGCHSVVEIKPFRVLLGHKLVHVGPGNISVLLVEALHGS